MNVHPEREALLALASQGQERYGGIPPSISSADLFIGHQQLHIWGVSISDRSFPFGFDPDILILGEMAVASIIPEGHGLEGCGCAVSIRRATEDECRVWNPTAPSENTALFCFESLRVAAATAGTIYFIKTGNIIFCTVV